MPKRTESLDCSAKGDYMNAITALARVAANTRAWQELTTAERGRIAEASKALRAAQQRLEGSGGG